MQRILLLTLAATLLVTTAWGEEKPDDKVQAALLEEANFEFIKVPVGKAMDTVRSQYKVKVEFDEGALREAGLDPESVVLEGALNGITLRSALQLALESVGMGYRAEKEAIVVTTAKNAPALKPGKLSQFEEDAYAKLHKKLAAETHIEFIRCPLIDALQYITELHGVQILLDRPAMNAAGLTGEEPVTVKARGVTLRSGLAHLLRAQGLTVIVRCEMLFLTTAEAAETYRDAIDLDQDREPDRLEAVNLKRIEVALDKVDRRKYLEVRLVDFADHLAQRTGVLVFLDRPALEEAEISAETKVSGEETEGPLRDALKSILAKKGLAFVVEHEAIIISPAKE